MPMNKRPCIVAGLMTALGLGATLVFAPTAALAEDLTGAPTGDAVPVEQGTPDSTTVVEDGDKDKGDNVVPTLPGNENTTPDSAVTDSTETPGSEVPGEEVSGSETTETPGEEGSEADGAEVETPGEEGTETDPTESESEDETLDDEGSEADGTDAETPGVEGAESDALTQTVTKAPSLSSSVGAIADSQKASLPKVGWDGNSYWDGKVDSSGAAIAYTGWVVDDHEGRGLQRYWIKDGKKFTNGKFAIGDGTFGYALDSWVLRSVKKVGNLVYIANNDGVLLAPGWHVTGDYTGGRLERYYVEADHAAHVGYASTGGYGHYTTGKGYVVRGKYDTGEGSVVLADNDGKVVEGTGWLVTGKYDGGELQRYWLVGQGQAHSSYFYVGNQLYFGLGGEGYVLRGVGVGVDGASLIADNDGRLAEGWVVTDDFGLGQGLQRYWFTNGRMVKGRMLTDAEAKRAGYYAYALSDGRILRGKLDNGKGRVYLADNDGRLAGSDGRTGWLVTGLYDGGVLQRYWIDGKDHAAASGFFIVDGSSYFGMASKGYVLRGATPWGSVMLIADNDGKMVGSAGTGVTAKAGSTSYKGNWLVTGGYFNSGALQRYFITAVPGQSGFFGALIGEFSVGKDDYYGRNDTGYVVRGLYIAPSGNVYYGDNDGVLGSIPVSQVAMNLWNRIKNVYSSTQYLIAVDCENCHTVVFQGRAGAWVPIFDWLCGVGLPQYNNGQGTIRGTYTIGGDGAYCNWANDPDYSEWGNPYDYQTRYFAKDDIKWYTNFCLDLGFHSTIGWEGGYSDPSQVGRKISHGCIRLLEENAKWIYFNATYGTTVVTI